MSNTVACTSCNFVLELIGLVVSVCWYVCTYVQKQMMTWEEVGHGLSLWVSNPIKGESDHDP